jgi:hypothetical protein
MHKKWGLVVNYLPIRARLAMAILHNTSREGWVEFDVEGDGI